MSEKEFQKKALAWLEMHRSVARVWSNDQSMTRMRKYTTGTNKKGLPDITGFLCDGRGPFFFELKEGYNKATEEQTDFIDCAKKNGYFAAVVWTMDELKEKFEDAISKPEKP